MDQQQGRIVRLIRLPHSKYRLNQISVYKRSAAVIRIFIEQ